MSYKIVRIEERLVYSDPNNKWVKLYFDKVRFPNGKEGYYNKIVESEGKQGVVILLISRGHIGLVHQYRYPISAEVWEIPRGFGETEDAEADAVRELLEETGINLPPDNLVDLGMLHPNSGMLSSVVRLFAAIYNQSPPISPAADEEVSKFMWAKYEDVLLKISKGEIMDSFTMAALLRAQTKGLIPFPLQAEKSKNKP
jgi:ADP-ribose pyrophosphatase